MGGGESARVASETRLRAPSTPPSPSPPQRQDSRQAAGAYGLGSTAADGVFVASLWVVLGFSLQYTPSPYHLPIPRWLFISFASLSLTGGGNLGGRTGVFHGLAGGFHGHLTYWFVVNGSLGRESSITSAGVQSEWRSEQDPCRCPGQSSDVLCYTFLVYAVLSILVLCNDARSLPRSPL